MAKKKSTVRRRPATTTPAQRLRTDRERIGPPAPPGTAALAAKGESRIVSGVGIAAESLENPALAEQVERAMGQAVTDSLAAGVSIEDSDALRAAMQSARQRVRREAGLPDDD